MTGAWVTMTGCVGYYDRGVGGTMTGCVGYYDRGVGYYDRVCGVL